MDTSELWSILAGLDKPYLSLLTAAHAQTVSTLSTLTAARAQTASTIAMLNATRLEISQELAKYDYRRVAINSPTLALIGSSYAEGLLKPHKDAFYQTFQAIWKSPPPMTAFTAWSEAIKDLSAMPGFSEQVDDTLLVLEGSPGSLACLEQCLESTEIADETNQDPASADDRTMFNSISRSPDQVLRIATIWTVAVWLGDTISLSISEYLTSTEPTFDVHQMLEDQNTALALALGVFCILCIILKK